MRSTIITMGVAALVAGALALAVHPASAAKTKLGCERGKEVWDASIGKCKAGTPKYSKKPAATKTAAKKAPAKKAQ